MKTLHMVTYSLVIVGALNWGLIGLFKLNVVNLLIGAWPGLEMLVYVLVGASAVYDFAMHMQYCMMCAEKKGMKAVAKSKKRR